MCGIAGVLPGQGSGLVDFDVLRSMAAALRHRGPDGYGLYRDNHVGLAHTRLSLIDPSGSFQPLTGEGETVWLTFNGEIFNFRELRRRLLAQGHRFRTNGDGEVVVHLYEELGARAWRELEGQFAFALWDRRRRWLWLVRDRFGILPLHYSRHRGHLVFGSEVKAIFASGFLPPPELDPGGLAEVFVRWSLSAPQTVFAGVQAVHAGTAMCFDAAGGVREERYWQLRFEPDQPGVRSLSDAAEELGDALDSAVVDRMRADVPVGVYLSGGLDSSMIALLAARSSDSPIDTFGITFRDERYDEAAQQREVAALIGGRHHEVEYDAADLWDVLHEVVWHTEMPLMRTAPIPLFLLARLVRGSGLSAVLTGEGADELLAGYGIFKEDKVRRFWARQPGSAIRGRLTHRLHPEVFADEARHTEMWRSFFATDLTRTDHPFYSHLIRWQNNAWCLRVLHPEVRRAAQLSVPDSALVDRLPKGWFEWDGLTRAQWLEAETFLSGYLLSCQGDRIAMAHGVEARYPFLAAGVVEVCRRLPAALRMPGLWDKAALRMFAASRLPRSVAMRRKRPYRAPFAMPLGTPSVEMIADGATMAGQELLNSHALTRLAARADARHGILPSEREVMAMLGAVTVRLLAELFGPQLSGRIAAARRQLDASRPAVFLDRSDAREPDVPVT
ncbi:asparagine synthase (glutamine-hydrolyzing) [Micromonospora sp. NPDC005652]|uniref:asparagine synthase (glutamine-hydrolyzing) n=1 Tax=Micromonospora sp. NPDC005652 TaxID=3157046 RepID=UPI003403D2D0